MLFFALKKNSINDATIKSPKSVSSQRSLTVFLEAEKNMFDHLKAFITLSFFLNTGCLAALFQFRPDIKCCIILLSIGTEISLILYCPTQGGVKPPPLGGGFSVSFVVCGHEQLS